MHSLYSNSCDTIRNISQNPAKKFRRHFSSVILNFSKIWRQNGNQRHQKLFVRLETN